MSFTGKKIHDVFLSFRGDDTRVSFTSHLYTSLINAGITVFRDDDSLQRGDSIYSIMQSIEESRIAIIIFSTNFVGSQWCLQELVKIMQLQKTRCQVVLPVFYDVDPSEVRHQTGEFGKVFQNLLSRITEDHELFVELKVSYYRRDEVKWTEAQWTEALRQAASLSGFVVLNFR
jgi:hypothetical protein